MITTAVFLSILVLPGLQAEADSDKDARIERARTLFAMIQAEQYEAFLAECNDTVRRQLPEAKLKAAWTQTVAAFGKPTEEIDAAVQQVAGHTVVVLTHKTTTGAIEVRITLDDANRVSGLFFVPSSAVSDYEPPGYVNTNKFSEEEVSVSAGEFQLSGTLTLPKAQGLVAAAVLVHGSGPHDRDETVFANKPFKDLAWGLASQGVAVLRYEKRTKQYAESMDPLTLTIDEESTDDALAAIKVLIDHPRVDGGRVYLIGHSLGAAAAPYIAHKQPRLAGIIMLAAPARPLYELVPDQQEYLFNFDGRIGPAEQQQLKRVREKVKAIREGTFGPDDKMLGAPSRYWRDLDRLNAVEYCRELSCPVLIVQGGRDYQVTDREFELWTDALGKRANVTLERIADLDHLMRAGTGPSTPQQYRQAGHADQRLIDLIAGWIKTVANGAPDAGSRP